MIRKANFIELEVVPKVQILTIDRKTKNIYLDCLAIRFRDADTSQIIIHLTALDITGYGSTLDRAKEMFDFSVNDFCSYILELSPMKTAAQLAKLGWKQSVIHKKEYSKSFVDWKGNFNGFNAVNNKVELVDVRTPI